MYYWSIGIRIIQIGLYIFIYKTLTSNLLCYRVDIYSSHEGELFCKPHFRDLFKPKVVVDNDEPGKFLLLLT